MKISNYWKFIAGFFGIIITIFILYFGGVWIFRAYQQWQGEKRVQTTVENLKKFEAEDYAKAMADTYGGKTPQETLQMYINAVEKGDYELASKYFIGDKQEEWKKELNNIKISGQIENFINPLKKALKFQEQCSNDKNRCLIYDPVVISFKKYPNNIWKIIEI